MQHFDLKTGFLIADPDNKYISVMPDYNSVLEAAKPMILSASGWRKIFAIDGDEESRTESISPEDYIIGTIMALSFVIFLKQKIPDRNPLILLGMDSRFTGPAIADAMTRVFLSEGIDVRSLFIVAAPEIMAYSAVNPNIDGFAYISASHNPVGHNGLKFGAHGGVFGGEESKQLITVYKNLLEDKNILIKIETILKKLNKNIYTNVLELIPEFKKMAYEDYLYFSKTIISNSNLPEKIHSMQIKFKEAAQNKKIGIVSELNGSARTLSIDKQIMKEYGISVISIHDKPRDIVHRIVPEGFSLNICRQELEKAYSKDTRYIMGYVPDNDGDRGNLVYIDKKTGKAEILEAQEVFALAVLSESAFMTEMGNAEKLAIAVNGPTSMRIDEIARQFGISVLRAEVGEANVVNLAKKLRTQGYKVRILGEGSNGGNITHPASVRDPINTVFSVIRLLLFQDLFKYWCKVSNQNEKFTENYGISDILETLPHFITTNAYNDKAIMKILTADHSILKKNYEEIFLIEWEKQRAFLKKTFQIYKWREVNYEGEKEKNGFGQEFRSGSEKGGLKIIFSDKTGTDTDFIWMRGSGTEPVFRILADCKGKDRERESWLLKWHRSVIERADRVSQFQN